MTYPPLNSLFSLSSSLQLSIVICSAFLRIRSSLYTLAAYSRSVSGWDKREGKHETWDKLGLEGKKWMNSVERLVLTCLSLFPAVISDVRYVVILHIFLNLLKRRALVLRFEVPRDVVVDVQVFCLSLHSLTSRPRKKKDGSESFPWRTNRV